MPVRAKKPTSTQRSVRYLLSADRKLQKLSLRKLSERLKKANPQPRSTPSKHAVAAKQQEPPPKAYSWRAIVIGMTCVLAAAALITARQPSEEADAASAEPPPAASAPMKTVTMGASPGSRKAAAPKTATAAAPRPTPATAPATPVADLSNAPTRPVEPASAPVATATITGCLERGGDAFWLKDTSGEHTPKSRSWRTGFLTRRSSRIELVDASHALNLSGHVGERVAASGTLVGRELRARSLRRVAASCN
jgi:hypothetical protein